MEKDESKTNCLEINQKLLLPLKIESFDGSARREDGFQRNADCWLFELRTSDTIKRLSNRTWSSKLFGLHKTTCQVLLKVDHILSLIRISHEKSTNLLLCLRIRLLSRKATGGLAVGQHVTIFAFIF